MAVITGLGIVSPIGLGIDKFWSSAVAGKAGVGHVTCFDASRLPPSCRIAGEVNGFDPKLWMPTAVLDRSSRYAQFAVAAARMALSDSGLDSAPLDGHGMTVAVGTSLSGIPDIGEQNLMAFLRGDGIAPSTVLEASTHAASSHVAIAVGARGHAASPASACAAGLDAIAWGAERIDTGAAKIVLAGGSDAPLSAFIMSAFERVGVLSRWTGAPSEASRPFDRHRSGMVLAEGAAVVVLEEEQHARARSARIYAVVRGTASVIEGEHLRRINTDGTYVASVLSQALRRARLTPTDIDHVCAHGNSMVDYDLAETVGIKKAFGRHAYCMTVSSIKSMCGQALAGAGAMQVVAGCLSIHKGQLAPTINLTEVDPNCDLDYVPHRGRCARVRSVAVHAQSLGGLHTAIILAAP